MNVELTTDRQIATLRAGKIRYEVPVGGGQGLSVRVSSTGAKQFALRYRLQDGRRRRLTIGTYPELSLVMARKEAANLQLAVLAGADPAGEAERSPTGVRSAETLDQLAEAYWAASRAGLHGGRRRPKREVTLANERALWRRHIRTPLGGRFFTGMRRADLKAYMHGLVLRGRYAPATIASVGGLLHSVFAYGVLEERLEANPMQGLARPIALTSRERMFDTASLKTIWDTASAAAAQDRDRPDLRVLLDPEMGLALKLLILTLTRRSEVAGARKAEFDLAARLWTIPSARAKAKHPHVVPLDAACMDVLEKAWSLHPESPYLFASPRVEGQHLDAHAVTRAISRICERHGLAKGSPHDVRRTGATTLTGQFGVTRFIVGLILGHTPKDGAAVTGVYDRYTYVSEKRQALEQWSRHLRGVCVATKATSEGEAVAAELQPDTDLAVDKAEALALCRAGALQDAVLTLSLRLAQRTRPSVPHLDILAKAGLASAAAGSGEAVEHWISGF